VCVIWCLMQDASGLSVTVHEESRHGLETGDCVTFAEVKGLTALNGIAAVPVTVTGPYSLRLDSPELAGMSRWSRLHAILWSCTATTSSAVLDNVYSEPLFQ
jgi:hypothetical protein